MQIGLAIVASGMLCTLKLSPESGPAIDIVHAKRLGTFHSKYNVYIAKMVLAEAGAIELTVTRSVDTAHGAVLFERDISGIIWDPDKPDRLIYSGSGVYGDGKIAVWNEGSQQAIFKGYVAIEDLRWDRSRRLLRFKTMRLDRDNDPWRQWKLKFK